MCYFTSMIKQSLAQLEAKIAETCDHLGRDPDEVTLIAVTKFAGVEQIQEALDAGITHIAENKVQEAQKKYPHLHAPMAKLSKHMIGHLQTNKVKTAVALFDMIQSVDSIRLAREIDKEAGKIGKRMNILIQVNTAGEEQKSGLAEQEVLSFIKEASHLKHIHIKGLMAIAPLTENEKIIRQCFLDLREIRDAVDYEFGDEDKVDMEFLSMGMSHDWPIALEEGANMLRIGSAIFGA